MQTKRNLTDSRNLLRKALRSNTQRRMNPNCIGRRLSILTLCIAIACFVLPSAAQTYRLDLVLLFDVSANMAGQLKIIKEGASPAASELSEGDRVAVMSYAKTAKIISSFTDDATQIEEAIQKVNAPLFKNSDLQCLNDALFEAIRQFPQKSEPDRKLAIGIITNNADVGSAHQNAELIKAAKARNIAVWVFLVDSPKQNSSQRQSANRGNTYSNVQNAKQQLGFIAEEIGGGAMAVEANGYVLQKAIAVCKGITR